MSEERYLPGPPATNRGILVTIFACVATALVSTASLKALGIEFQPLAIALAAAITGIVLFTGVMLWFLFLTNRFYADTDQALAGLARGEFERAAELWSAWEGRYGPEQVRAQAAHNLGWTVMRQGEPRRALKILGVNDLMRRAGLQRTHLAATTAQDLALCNALIGDLETAEAWLAESERRKTSKAPSTFDAMAVFVRAVLDCRAGRMKEAARALQAEFEGTPDALRRVLHILRLFANGEKKPSIPKSVRPAYPREYAFLGVEWPEMAAFLARHDLAL